MRAWFVILVSAVFYGYQSIIRVSSSGVGEDLVKQFSITDHRLGIFSAAFFFSYTLMQIPVGLTLDRFGPRRLLPWMAFICGAGCICFSFAPYFAVVSLSRFMTGFAAAFAFIGCLKLINNWFPSDRISMMTGIVFAIGALGSILGEEPFDSLVNHIGWRNSMLLLGIIGIFLCILLKTTLKDEPSGECAIVKKPFYLYKKELKEVFRNKQLWLITAYSSFVAMPVYTLSSLWGVPFIMVRYQVNEKIAAGAISLIFLGGLIGGSLWGAYSDYLKRRIPFLFIAAIAPAFFLLIIIYYPFSNIIVPSLLLFCFGFFDAAYLSSFAMVCEISKPAHVGTALGLVNMVNTLLVTVSLPVLGRLLDFFWSGELKQGVKVYQLGDYQISMTVIVFLIVISLFFLFFIKETHGKPLYPKNVE